MIIAGIFLSIIGLFLCFTIFWAPVGILLMLIGGALTTVGIFGRRKTVITNVVQVSNMPGQGMQATVPVDTEESRVPQTRRLEAPLNSSQSREQDRRLSSPPLIDVTPRETQNSNEGQGYDRAKWNALVQYDEDISRVVKALAPFDKKYTDQFAAAYLALNDKTYLSIIVQKILVTAKEDLATRSRRI